MNRTDRLLAIVLHIQSKGTVRAEDLAAFFETSRRTIYRDVLALCEAGVPIVATPGQGYRLSEGYFLPPISFSTDEAVMLLLGGAFMAQSFDAQYGAAAEAACLKIGGVLPERTRAEVRQLQDNIWFIPDTGGDLSLLRSLRRAIVERHSVRFHYHARSSGEAEREANPHRLVHHDGGWTLVAYDHARNAERRFRLERMEGVKVTPHTFTRRPDIAMIGDAPDNSRTVTVRVLFDAAIARWVRESANFFATGYEDTADGLLVTLLVRDVRDVLGWLLGWGGRACVLQPDALKEIVRDEAQAIVQRYQNPVSLLT